MAKDAICIRMMSNEKVQKLTRAFFKPLLGSASRIQGPLLGSKRVPIGLWRKRKFGRSCQRSLPEKKDLGGENHQEREFSRQRKRTNRWKKYVQVFGKPKSCIFEN